MRIVAKAVVAVTIGLTVASTKSSELSEGEKRIYSASIVLASASGMINGQVRVKSDKYADFIPGWQTNAKIHIEQTADCVYVEVINGNGDYEDSDVKIDFSKLDGRWRESGNELAFLSKGPSHCVRKSEKDVTCWKGITYIPYSIRHAQLVDDVNYVLRHGCGASTDPDPY